MARRWAAQTGLLLQFQQRRPRLTRHPSPQGAPSAPPHPSLLAASAQASLLTLRNWKFMLPAVRLWDLEF